MLALGWEGFLNAPEVSSAKGESSNCDFSEAKAFCLSKDTFLKVQKQVRSLYSNGSAQTRGMVGTSFQSCEV